MKGENCVRKKERKKELKIVIKKKEKNKEVSRFKGLCGGPEVYFGA
jgi:hypothetical protein